MRTAAALLALTFSACLPAFAEDQSQGLGALSLSAASALDVPGPSAAAADKKTSSAASSAAESYDPELGRRLASAAEAGNIGRFTGKCYTYVAWHMDAAGVIGFYDWASMGIEPDYSSDAADFFVWAAANKEKMRREMRLAVMPTPQSKDEVPLGSILVYDRGWCGFSEASGHIEVLTAPDRACSDGCEGLDNSCFSDPAVRGHVHVIIPVKN